MAQTANVNFRMDAELKRSMELVCEAMGMSMTTAFTIFAKRVIRDNMIPFDIIGDPFYNESNTRYLESVLDDIKAGRAQFEMHDLIEEA